MPGIKWLHRKAAQTYRLSSTDHPVTAGLPDGLEISAVPFPPGGTWARFGNEVWPIIYVDPKTAGRGTHVLGHWLIEGKVREDMAALCVRTVRRLGKTKWNSVYAAVPYLTPELMRNIARFAGVHIYRDSNEILFAGRHFVALHTGKERATGDLRLPARTTVYDVFAGETAGDNTDTIQLDIDPYSTKLYYLGNPAKFREATGR
jgi:hypothetical protein